MRQQHNFLTISILIGTIIFPIVYSMPFRFQVNDDVLMMWLVSGAYTGSPEAFAVFIHPLLSMLMASLYSLLPPVPWYPIIWFTVIYLSYCQWVLIVHNSKIPNQMKWLWLGVFLTYTIHHLYFLQFTAIAGIAGFVGLLSLVTVQPKKPHEIILPYTLVLLGYMIREDSVYLMIIGFGLYLLLQKGVGSIVVELKTHRYLLLLLALIFVHKQYFINQPLYQEYTVFNKARAKIIDHPVFQMNKVVADENQEPDWRFFKEWLFEHQGLSTEELLEKKVELDQGLYSFQYIARSIDRLLSSKNYENFKILLFILAVLMFGFFALVNRTSILLSISWVLLFLLLNFYFKVTGRVYTLMILMIIGYTFLLQVKFFSNKRVIYSISILAFFLVLHSINVLKANNHWQRWTIHYEEAIANVPKGSIIFLDDFSVELIRKDYNFLNPTPVLILGWISRSPMQKAALSRFEVSQINEVTEFYLLEHRKNDPSLIPEYFKFLNGLNPKRLVVENETFKLTHYEN